MRCKPLIGSNQSPRTWLILGKAFDLGRGRSVVIATAKYGTDRR